jgi:hypothetical protein
MDYIFFFKVLPKTVLIQVYLNIKDLRQLDSNNAISQHISSDLDSIESRLKVIANSVYAQQGNLSGNGIQLILQEMYNDTTQLVGKADYLFIVDRNGIITHIASDQGEQRSFVGNNISFREYANQTKATLRPVFSTGLLSSDGVYRIIITYLSFQVSGMSMILNRNTWRPLTEMQLI